MKAKEKKVRETFDVVLNYGRPYLELHLYLNSKTFRLNN